MAFRDETEALRARVRSLEVELERASRELDALRDVSRERDRLAARVSELEQKLGAAAAASRAPAPEPAPRPPPPPPEAPEPTTTPLSRLPLVIAGVVVASALAWAVQSGQFEGPDEDAAPTHGMIDLDLHPSPPERSAEVTGTVDADNFGTGCRGHLERAPFVVLRTSGPTPVRVWTDSSTDLVLVLQTADGAVHCDDDSGNGMNPMLRVQLPAGDHRVWVGTYGEDVTAPFVFHADTVDTEGPLPGALPAATPRPTIDVEAAPTGDTLAVDRDPFSWVGAHRLPAHPVRASDVSAGCVGWVPVAPLLALDSEHALALDATTRSTADLVMMVRDSSGAFSCDDDSGESLNPRVQTTVAPGRTTLWIGSFAESLPARVVQVHISAHALPASLAPLRLLEEAPPPTLGEVVLEGSGAVAELSGEASGDTPAAAIEASCTGFVSSAPTIAISTPEGRDMTLTASDERLELLVVHADGTGKCHSAQTPLVGTWPAGRHLVWLGVPHARESIPFTLTLAEGPSHGDDGE